MKEITREQIKATVFDKISWYRRTVTEDTVVDIVQHRVFLTSVDNGEYLSWQERYVCVRKIINYFYCAVMIQNAVSQKRKRDVIVYTHDLLYATNLTLGDIEHIFAKVWEDCLVDLNIKPLPMSHYFHGNVPNLDIARFCKLTSEVVEQIRKEKTAET